jgi:hypothetical protein
MKDTDDYDERMDASMDCERAIELVPTFVDGEASESLASAMRQHLIDCYDCRSAVQEESGLRQWFEPLAGEAGLAGVEVPEGFAARVTQLAVSESAVRSVDLHAFRGSTGEERERRAPRPLRSVGAEAPTESNSLGFLMGMTALAAALMVSFTLMLAQDSRVDVGDKPLSAGESLEEGLRKIEAERAAYEEKQKETPEIGAMESEPDAESKHQAVPKGSK